MSSSAVPNRAALGARRGFALGLLTSANLLVFASVTIMNLALPDVRTDLLLSHGQAQGVVTFYSLAFGALLVLGVDSPTLSDYDAVSPRDWWVSQQHPCLAASPPSRACFWRRGLRRVRRAHWSRQLRYR